MQITMRLRPDVAEDVQKGTQSGPSKELFQTARELGISLQAMHPDTNDPNLMSYFVINIAASNDAELIAQRLRQCPGVEAAYLKPADEAP